MVISAISWRNTAVADREIQYVDDYDDWNADCVYIDGRNSGVDDDADGDGRHCNEKLPSCPCKLMWCECVLLVPVPLCSYCILY